MIQSIEEIAAAREALDYYTCPYCYPEECSCFPESYDTPIGADD